MKRFLLVHLFLLFAASIAVVSTAHAAEKTDEKAESLLLKLAEATQTTKTLTADLEMSYQTPGSVHNTSRGTLRLMKPNFALITLMGEPAQTLASDGTNLYMLSAKKRYERTQADPQGGDIVSPWWGLPFRYFFTRTLGLFGPTPAGTAQNRYVGIETVHGEMLEVLEQTVAAAMPYTMTPYIGSDNLLHRTVVRFGQGANAATFETLLTKIQIDKTLSPADFQYTLPAGAEAAKPLASGLLASGTLAPPFTLPTPTGNYLSLADILQSSKSSSKSKRGRATLINFWYVNCHACLSEFPHLQQLYSKLKAEGFTIVAIDYNDPAASVRRFMAQNKYTFPVVVGQVKPSSVFNKYKVEAFPTTYLLDTNGKVVKAFVGFDEKQGLRDLEAALRQLGFKI